MVGDQGGKFAARVSLALKKAKKLVLSNFGGCFADIFKNFLLDGKLSIDTFNWRNACSFTTRLFSSAPTFILYGRFWYSAVYSTVWEARWESSSKQARSHRGAFGGSYPKKIFFVSSQTVLCSENFFQAYNKNKNLSCLKMYFDPRTLKPGYGPEVVNEYLGESTNIFDDFIEDFLYQTFTEEQRMFFRPSNSPQISIPSVDICVSLFFPLISF